ncbi:glycosyltransferase family 4 protein [Pedobacter miscanthi]|uniref:glycosyltransferase family 4 protein n=1 Tax=Pedobacter miscanthi TaxID=2259170 RepID=UPI0029301148|nr:glycosyltransferase family 4 protein [Pedobacter miscanthi]
MKKLAIITTHPIQYYAPVFKLLAKKTQLKVFYTWGEQSMVKYDKGFAKQIEWDIPLLDGYDYQFLANTSKDPGTHHFNGIINPGLVSAVQDFEPNAILIYGWAWKSHLKALRFFKGKIPIYFRGDSTLLDQQNNFKNLLRKIFLKWIYSHVDKAFYVGSTNKNYYSQFGLKEKQLIFAPHAIDNNRFEKIDQQETIKIRKKLSIGADSILILFAGKLEPKKAPDLLLKALKKLANPNLQLLFVGNGQLQKELKTTAGNFSNIHFMDFQNQSKMPAIYQACDLFCLPSKGPNETWGLAVNEAMAAGKAILVSTKVGCAVDLVKPGINGEVFKSNDLDDLMQKLTELAESKEKLTKMGIQSQQIIQNWSFEKQVEAIVNTFYNKNAK